MNINSPQNEDSKAFIGGEDKILVYKNHIASIFLNSLGFFTFIVIIMIQNLDEFLKKGIKESINEINVLFREEIQILIFILLGLLGIFLLLLLLNFFKWKNTYILLHNDHLYMKRQGLFSKMERKVAYVNIANITRKGSILAQIVGAEKIGIDINSSETAKKDDYSLILSKKDAKEFQNNIFMRQNRTQLEKERERGVETCLDMNREAEEEHIIYEKVFSKSEKMKHIFLETGMSTFIFTVSSIVLVIAGILEKRGLYLVILLPFFFSMLKKIYSNVNKYKGFSVKRSNDSIYISYGLFDTRKYSIKVDKIISINLEQGIVARILKYSIINFEVIGVGNNKDEKSQLSLYLPNRELNDYVQNLIPEFSLPDRHFEKQGLYASIIEMSIRLFVVSGILIASLYTGLCQLTYEFSKVIFFGVLLFGLYYLLSRALSIFVNRGIQFGEGYINIRRGGFSRFVDSIHYEKVDQIKIVQGVLEKQLNLEKVIFVLRDSKGKNSVKTGYYEVGKFENIKNRMILGNYDPFEKAER